MWCDSRTIGRAVNTAATVHTAEAVRIPEAIGMARKITDQITPNCGGGGGVPLTKAKSTPAMPISRPDSPKITTFCTQRRTPTASAPSGWWPVITQFDRIFVFLTRHTASVTARHTRPVMRNTTRVVVKKPLMASGWATPRPEAPPVSQPIENTTFSMPIWTTSEATVKYSPVTTRDARPPAIETATHRPTPTRTPRAVLPAWPPWAWKAKK